MVEFIDEFLGMFRPCFSRRAAYGIFLLVFTGLLLRGDHLGVSSIVRVFDVSPAIYPCLLHFFHASSWRGPRLLDCCAKWIAANDLPVLVDGRIVLLGDETKVPKEGRRMPLVGTIRQTSETSSKPSHFRGHEWIVIGLLTSVAGKYFCAPTRAWLPVVDTNGDGDGGHARTADVVRRAALVAENLGRKAFLVLDAFYSVGPVLKEAAKGEWITVVTRAKSNCVAHEDPQSPQRRGRGRPREYGEKIKVAGMFKSRLASFETVTAAIYGKMEQISVLAVPLHWKPAKAKVLFVLAITSRGMLTLMCTDLSTPPGTVVELYCRRTYIEVMFDNVKNLLGLFNYRFWSPKLGRQSRIPLKNKPGKAAADMKIAGGTVEAMSNFLHVGLVALCFLQVFSCKFGPAVVKEANCWMRTPSGEVPTEFVAKAAAAAVLRRFLSVSASNPIACLIRGTLGRWQV